MNSQQEHYIDELHEQIANLEADLREKDKELMSEYKKYSGHVEYLKGKWSNMEAQNKELTENYLKNWNTLQDQNRLMRESLLWIIDHSKHRLSKFSKEIRGKAEQALKTI